MVGWARTSQTLPESTRSLMRMHAACAARHRARRVWFPSDAATLHGGVQLISMCRNVPNLGIIDHIPLAAQQWVEDTWALPVQKSKVDIL